GASRAAGAWRRAPWRIPRADSRSSSRRPPRTDDAPGVRAGQSAGGKRGVRMHRERGNAALAGAVAFAGTFLMFGCADRAPTGERVVARPTAIASAIPSRVTGASVEERFGLPPSGPKPDAGVAEAAGMMRWDTPAGWVERPPSAMRIANFLAAGDPGAECYLTILAGDAGRIGANVNRWLGQMGQPALGPAQIDALPRATLFQREAVFLETEGSFTGMSGGAA